jgi:hypothetical protein
VSDININRSASNSAKGAATYRAPHWGYPPSTITEQMRAIGERRRAAEAKLAQHLQEAQGMSLSRPKDSR